MDTLTYIHAADLHLDAPFLGISRKLARGDRLTKQLRQATFTALERLEKLCLEQHPDFLVLAGDLANSEEQSIRARLHLIDLCRSLQNRNIRVFIIHGNHDPLETSFRTVPWPSNVTVFGAEPRKVLFSKNDTIQAVIHGMSHLRAGESRNLSRFLKRDMEYPNSFQLGLLHCMVHGSIENDDCAPCSLEDLVQTRLDAFALGHVHRPLILRESAPFVAYSGSLQGLHINEEGDHGCFLVATEKEGSSWVTRATFCPLAPIVWKRVSIDISQAESLEEIVQTIETTLETTRMELTCQVQTVIVRLILTGTTPFEYELARNREDILEEFSALESSTPSLWIRDLELATDTPVSREKALQRDDLIGSILRYTDSLSANAALDMVQSTLSPLYEHPQLRKILPGLTQESLQGLLKDAEKLCLQHLEEHRVH